jgi:hypothetical protein
MSSVIIAHGAERNRTASGAYLFGRLTGTLDAQVIPHAKLQGAQRADPTIGQVGEHFLVQQDFPRGERRHAEEQHDDGYKSDRGNDEINRQGRIHTAVIEPG